MIARACCSCSLRSASSGSPGGLERARSGWRLQPSSTSPRGMASPSRGRPKPTSRTTSRRSTDSEPLGHEDRRRRHLAASPPRADRKLDIVVSALGPVIVPRTGWSELIQAGTQVDVVEARRAATWLELRDDPRYADLGLDPRETAAILLAEALSAEALRTSSGRLLARGSPRSGVSRRRRGLAGPSAASRPKFVERPRDRERNGCEPDASAAPPGWYFVPRGNARSTRAIHRLLRRIRCPHPCLLPRHPLRVVEPPPRVVHHHRAGRRGWRNQGPVLPLLWHRVELETPALTAAERGLPASTPRPSPRCTLRLAWFGGNSRGSRKQANSRLPAPGRPAKAVRRTLGARRRRAHASWAPAAWPGVVDGRPLTVWSIWTMMVKEVYLSTIVSLSDAKARLSEVVRSVRTRGEDAVITVDGEPAVRLVPVHPGPRALTPAEAAGFRALLSGLARIVRPGTEFDAVDLLGEGRR